MKHSFPWVYCPGFLDRIDPTVIKGTAIMKGQRVRVAREFNPPQYPSIFRMIEDTHGNVQSVYKAALRRANTVTGGLK